MAAVFLRKGWGRFAPIECWNFFSRSLYAFLLPRTAAIIFFSWIWKWQYRHNGKLVQSNGLIRLPCQHPGSTIGSGHVVWYSWSSFWGDCEDHTMWPFDWGLWSFGRVIGMAQDWVEQLAEEEQCSVFMRMQTWRSCNINRMVPQWLASSSWQRHPPHHPVHNPKRSPLGAHAQAQCLARSSLGSGTLPSGLSRSQTGN